MSLLSSLFKSRKQNLTPDVQYKSPDQASPLETPLLRDFANSRIRGENLGFGPEYLDKVTNPVIAASQRRFQNETVPGIQNAFSARGLGRSAGAGLAVDTLGKAQQEQQSQVDQLLANFYNLNEAQKKQDQTQALNLGQNLMQADIGQENQKAAASERLANATAANSQQREARDAGLAGNILQSVGGFVSGGGLGQVGSLFKNVPMIGPSVNGAFQSLNNVGTSTSGGFNILGKYTSQSFSQLQPAQMAQALEEYFASQKLVY